jgi:hypothetical protein
MSSRFWNPGGPEPPRIWPLWDAVVVRLRSPEMIRLLGGDGSRVFAPHEDETVTSSLVPPWARVVILGVQGTFDFPDDVGADRVVPWLVRCDVCPPGVGSYNAGRLLDALHGEAWRRLRGWVPGVLPHVEVHLPVWRETAPQGMPLWDQQGGTYYTSAQYRAIAEPLTPED